MVESERVRTDTRGFRTGGSAASIVRLKSLTAASDRRRLFFDVEERLASTEDVLDRNAGSSKSTSSLSSEEIRIGILFIARRKPYAPTSDTKLVLLSEAPPVDRSYASRGAGSASS